jgi:hypothetical protein
MGGDAIEGVLPPATNDQEVPIPAVNLVPPAQAPAATQLAPLIQIQLPHPQLEHPRRVLPVSFLQMPQNILLKHPYLIHLWNQTLSVYELEIQKALISPVNEKRVEDLSNYWLNSLIFRNGLSFQTDLYEVVLKGTLHLGLDQLFPYLQMEDRRIIVRLMSGMVNTYRIMIRAQTDEQLDLAVQNFIKLTQEYRNAIQKMNEVALSGPRSGEAHLVRLMQDRGRDYTIQYMNFHMESALATLIPITILLEDIFLSPTGSTTLAFSSPEWVRHMVHQKLLHYQNVAVVLFQFFQNKPNTVLFCERLLGLLDKPIRMRGHMVPAPHLGPGIASFDFVPSPENTERESQ